MIHGSYSCETGTGKELIARAITNDRGAIVRSSASTAQLFRPHSSFRAVRHEKGASPGRSKDVWPFRTANGGTIFLDEIGDSGEIQIALLRVLQERESNASRKHSIPLTLEFWRNSS